MANMQRPFDKPANMRFKYTLAQIARFKSNPDKYRNRAKWTGITIDHDHNDDLVKNDMPIIAMEDIDRFLDMLYKDPKFGFVGADKLYSFIKRHYIGISRRQVSSWMNRNEVDQIHQPPRKQNVARPIVVSKPMSHVQADLTIWEKYRTKNKNYAYILAVVDLNTKFLWMEPVKRKTAIHVNDALVKILGRMPKMPKIFQTDNGGEFMDQFHKTLKDKGIKHVFSQSHSPTTQGAIERTQGSIKRRIGKYFTLNNTRVWIDVLEDLVLNYNETEHSTTKQTPIEMLYGGRTDEETERIRRQGNEGIEKRANKMIQSNTRRFPELHRGDWVRVILTAVDHHARARELKGQRHASIEQNWTKDLYQIVDIKQSRKYLNAPKSYKLKDADGTVLKGLFYRDRLRLQQNPDKMVFHPKDTDDDVKKLDDDKDDDEEDKDNEIQDDSLEPSSLKERRRQAEDKEDAKLHKVKKKALRDQAAGKSLAAGREARARKAPARYKP